MKTNKFSKPLFFANIQGMNGNLTNVTGSKSSGLFTQIWTGDNQNRILGFTVERDATGKDVVSLKSTTLDQSGNILDETNLYTGRF